MRHDARFRESADLHTARARLTGIEEEVQQCRSQHLRIRTNDLRGRRVHDRRTLRADGSGCARYAVADHGIEVERLRQRLTWTSEAQDIVHLRVERVDAPDHGLNHIAFPGCRDEARLQDLERCAKTGEWVAHFVRHDCGKLPELCERRLIRKLGFRRFFLRNVAADGQVLPRFSSMVQAWHDRRINPVEGPVFRSVADLATPDPTVGDRPPQVAHEFLRVVPGIDDAMVLAEEFISCVLGDIAELVVRVRDDPSPIRCRDDGRLIQCLTQFLQTNDGLLEHRLLAFDVLAPPIARDAVVGNESGTEPDDQQLQRNVDPTDFDVAALGEQEVIADGQAVAASATNSGSQNRPERMKSSAGAT